MNNLPRKIVTIFVAIFLWVQTCNGIFISNWLFAKYKNTIWGEWVNETLSYNIEVEVLENPITVKYQLGVKNAQLLSGLKKRWYEWKINNYLWLKPWDIISYPFRIQQTYVIKNTTDAAITIPMSYFPLNANSAFAYSYPFLDNTIQIWENYWVRNVIVTQDKMFIPRTNEYTVNTDFWNIVIQLEPKWNIKIQAWETSTIVLSYYATDVPTSAEIDESYYATYQFWWIPAAEPLYSPYKHTLILPKWFVATSTTSHENIEWPYKWVVELSEFWNLKIYTQK